MLINITAPTREIELPISKAKIVFKEWLTEAEGDVVKEPMRRHDVEVTEGKTTQRFAAEIMKEIEHLTIKAAVVSINGETATPDEILKVCRSLPEKDYEFMKKEIDNVLSPPKEQKA